MTYKRFEDLPVWQSAAALFDGVDDFLAGAPSQLRPSFRDQLERAALSVSNNIAEGFERGTTNELLAFIYIARGSAGEVRSMLCVLERRPWVKHCLPQLRELKTLAESCSRQLRAWAESLQNSTIEGPRRLNDKTRRHFEEAERAKKFRLDLLRRLPENHPTRRDAVERGLI
jgi:four helix bundle protein